jgi:hypothetical protein
MHEADLFAHSLSPASLFAALYDRLRCVHAGHCSNTAKSNKKAHAGAVTTTQVHAPQPGPDLGALGQISGGLEASDVDLLSHQQFPQFALDSGIDGAYGFERVVSSKAHVRPPQIPGSVNSDGRASRHRQSAITNGEQSRHLPKNHALLPLRRLILRLKSSTGPIPGCLLWKDLAKRVRDSGSSEKGAPNGNFVNSHRSHALVSPGAS